ALTTAGETKGALEVTGAAAYTINGTGVTLTAGAVVYGTSTGAVTVSAPITAGSTTSPTELVVYNSSGNANTISGAITASGLTKWGTNTIALSSTSNNF